MDLATHRVKRMEKDVHLGPTEFRLLRFLMENQGRVFSRERLLDHVWGRDIYVEPQDRGRAYPTLAQGDQHRGRSRRDPHRARRRLLAGRRGLKSLRVCGRSGRAASPARPRRARAASAP